MCKEVLEALGGFDERLKSSLNKHRNLFKIYPQIAVSFYNNIVSVCIANRNYSNALQAFIKSFTLFPRNLSIVANWIKVL